MGFGAIFQRFLHFFFYSVTCFLAHFKSKPSFQHFGLHLSSFYLVFIHLGASWGVGGLEGREGERRKRSEAREQGKQEKTQGKKREARPSGKAKN